MPIYEYYCTDCKLQFELILPFSKSDKSAKCLKCKKLSQKLISNFASKTGSYLQAPEKTLKKITNS
jgi:putative FmdB family regulatory protein